jgi:glutaredoxin-like YruB-family protein
MSEVLIYTTPSCTYCKTAKSYFQQHDIDYTEIDVSRDPVRAQEMINKSGQTGVPVIDVDGEIIIGFDKRRLARALDLEG